MEDDGAGLEAGAPAPGARRPGAGDGRTSDARSGLGLAFARSLAQGIGGDLELRSEPGRGTLATLELPAAGLHEE